MAPYYIFLNKYFNLRILLNIMNVFECILTRRSIRHFEKKPVDDKLIGVMLYMASHSPSAGNTQEWNFIVVRDEEIKKKLAYAALRQMFIAEAPVVIVVCSDLKKIELKYGNRGKELYSIQDTANATMSILLTANALGLGSCWVGAFDEDSVRNILDLPENLRPIAIVPIGYPAEAPSTPYRIPIENLTYIEKYGKKSSLVALQPEARLEETLFKPLSDYIQEMKKGRSRRKKLSFLEFLRILGK